MREAIQALLKTKKTFTVDMQQDIGNNIMKTSRLLKRSVVLNGDYVSIKGLKDFNLEECDFQISALDILSIHEKTAQNADRIDIF